MILFGLAAVCCSAAARAGGEPAQLLAAELSILAGDARRLAQERMGPEERSGLAQRIRGDLSALPLTMRRAGVDPQPVGTLREAVARADWRALATALAALARHHPFTTGFMSLPATAQRRAAGATLHKEICAACHEADWGDMRLPPKNLAILQAGMPREEFAARLWLGVRGTRDVAYANPFSDNELAGLMAFHNRSVTAKTNAGASR